MKKFRFRGKSRAAAILLLTLVILGVAAGLLLDQVRGPRWTASTNVLVQVSPGSVNSLLLTGQVAAVTPEDVADAATLAVSQTVLTQVAQKLNDSAGWTDVASRVSAATVPASHLLTVTATAADQASALRTSKLVASTLVDVSQQQLSYAAANLPPVAAGGDADLQRRVQLLTKTLQPMQAFSTAQPQQVLPSAQTPVALGIVGLAAGALVIVLLTLLRPTIRRPRDAQLLVELPAVGFRLPEGGTEVARVIRGFLDGRARGPLLICPVDAHAEKEASDLVEWSRLRIDPEAVAASRVLVVPEPAGSVVNRRLRPADPVARVVLLPIPAVTVAAKAPSPEEASALLLVVPQGTRRQVVADAVALMESWRPVNAVVVTAA